VADYVKDLNTALTTAGINNPAAVPPVTNVTVAVSPAGVLSISGTGVSTSGSVIQDPVGTGTSPAIGTLTFDSSGNLVSPAANVSGISFAGLSDGAATVNLTWGLFGANGSSNISQTASADSTTATSQNGSTRGVYEGFSINSSGLVTAQFSNSQTETVGQIAIATVSNEQGLQMDGNTNYSTTTASGDASVGVAGTGGRGTIEGSSLEASNVNISAEFSDLIVAQRAFEANSKAVTTFDTITQETINMIH